MTSKVNRRRFLKGAATGIAAGAIATAAGSALAAENPSASASIPLPDGRRRRLLVAETALNPSAVAQQHT